MNICLQLFLASPSLPVTLPDEYEIVETLGPYLDDIVFVRQAASVTVSSFQSTSPNKRVVYVSAPSIAEFLQTAQTAAPVAPSSPVLAPALASPVASLAPSV